MLGNPTSPWALMPEHNDTDMLYENLPLSSQQRAKPSLINTLVALAASDPSMTPSPYPFHSPPGVVIRTREVNFCPPKSLLSLSATTYLRMSLVRMAGLALDQPLRVTKRVSR